MEGRQIAVVPIKNADQLSKLQKQTFEFRLSKKAEKDEK
jgi:hypothetical protein